MQQIIKKSWNGFEIEFELIDGQLMANATAMCAAFGKKPAKWTELESTKKYLVALEAEDAKKSLSEIRTLVETRNGGSNPGTWIVEDLILELAGWLNTPFKIQMHKWVAELLRTGKVELQQPLSAAALIHAQSGLLLDHENRMLALERENDARRQKEEATQQQLAGVKQELAEVAARQVVTEVDYYQIKGWAKLRKKTVTESEAKALGVKAGALSRARGVRIDKVPNGSWGTVNSYHKSILQEIF